MPPGTRTAFVMFACALALAAGAASSCGKTDRSCPVLGAYQCDFYVEALMVCAVNAEGKQEWETARICPQYHYCTSNVSNPDEACLPIGADIAEDGQIEDAEADGATDGAETGEGLDSVEDFIDLLMPGDVSR